ncbi:diaminopropionate ammonia-lyase [Streptomyces sp. NPDC002514]|uniref:diaminopropionate ammonia-lyase n=1 Tax=Streptomyces sp. NPDC001270 TaxID=3364554 RepID=UPI0036B9C472
MPELPSPPSAHPTPPWIVRPTARAWRCAPAPAGVRAFHATLPDYSPTPLTRLPVLEAESAVGRIYVKDESCRLGLPAFKALGASWAIHRALADRTAATADATHNRRPHPDVHPDVHPHPHPNPDPLPTPVTLVTATDGNHGRAVARMARLLGQRAHVFVPRGVHPQALAAIVAERATVTEVQGPYDEAVRRAAEEAAEPCAVLVQDTAWPGYERIPGWIVEGYSTLCAEIDEQLRADGVGEGPNLVSIPVGVGSLAQAVVTHYRSRPSVRAPALLSVEPRSAACVLASLVHGAPVSVTTGDTIMAGLNCGTPSSIAWPYLNHGLDAAVAVSDADTARAAARLAALGVSAGPCGAAALAGLRTILTGPDGDARRTALGLDTDSVIVLLNTEGTAANPHAPADDVS